MDLSYLHEYIIFSNYMNVSAASRRLHVSQPTLSNHIASLEKELDVKLLNHANPLSLTVPGKLFVTRASELLDHYNSIVSEVREADSAVLDLNIAIDSTETAPHHTLVARCYQLCDQDPNFFVHYQECRENTAAAALKNPALDCVAVYLQPIPSDLETGVVYRRVPSMFPNKLLISLDKRHPLAARESVRWADLADMSYPLADGYFRLWASSTRAALEQNMADPKIVPVALEVQSFIRSLGVNDFQLFDEGCKNILLLQLDERRVMVPLDEPKAFSECYIAYNPDRVSPALKKLLAYLDSIDEGREEQ